MTTGKPDPNNTPLVPTDNPVTDNPATDSPGPTIDPSPYDFDKISSVTITIDKATLSGGSNSGLISVFVQVKGDYCESKAATGSSLTFKHACPPFTLMFQDEKSLYISLHSHSDEAMVGLGSFEDSIINIMKRNLKQSNIHNGDEFSFVQTFALKKNDKHVADVELKFAAKLAKK